MNKRAKSFGVGIAAVFVALAALTAGIPSAHAEIPTGEGTYHVEGGDFFLSALELAFRAENCSPSVADGPLNGVDALIIDIGEIATQSTTPGGRPTVRLQWKGTVGPLSSTRVTVWSAQCRQLRLSDYSSSSADINVTGGKWLVFFPQLSADVSVSLTDITP